MDEIKKSDIIGGIVLFLLWTVMIFLLGALWQLDQDLKQVKKIDITTKIIEYRMGNVTLGRDTVNVIKEKPKMKAYEYVK
jgi:hypothetical protein